MSEFVDECLREWRRLGVPEAVANEMAADLKADLDEAEAEGVSAEAVLGSSAFDPRSFAASWAAERGVIQPPPAPPVAHGSRAARRPLVIAAIALILVIIGALVLSVHRSVVIRRTARFALPAPLSRQVVPAGPSRLRLPPGARLLPSATGFAVNVNGPDDGYFRAIGLLLLILGIAGLVVALYWSPWLRPRHRGP